MVTDQIAAIARSLPATPSRRDALRVLAGLGLLGTGSALERIEVDAKPRNAGKSVRADRKGKRKGKKRKGKGKENGGRIDTSPPPSPSSVRTFATPGTFAYIAPGTGTVTVEALGAGGGNGGAGGGGVGGGAGSNGRSGGGRGDVINPGNGVDGNPGVAGGGGGGGRGDGGIGGSGFGPAGAVLVSGGGALGHGKVTVTFTAA